ncbi:hypothetical protein CCAX7_001670 [Capsulimonas corticalis]|uniref:Uncharacterized protein n=1 Tax=Capsulimonas corticalis TaxID=2219043 RepID=A0A402CRZ6_9BACT|nr:DUF2283 domain-containing protein [Capsulimonas corticalis]BDI28116.1 hypothetical protein CCAX7_001670 [Capsulimonas corticalis]
MKITYNPHDDTLRILFNNAPIFKTGSPNGDVTLDYDQHSRLVGIEVSAASKHVANPYDIDIVTDGACDGSDAAII